MIWRPVLSCLNNTLCYLWYCIKANNLRHFLKKSDIPKRYVAIAYR